MIGGADGTARRPENAKGIAMSEQNTLRLNESEAIVYPLIGETLTPLETISRPLEREGRLTHAQVLQTILSLVKRGLVEIVSAPGTPDVHVCGQIHGLIIRTSAPAEAKVHPYYRSSVQVGQPQP